MYVLSDDTFTSLLHASLYDVLFSIGMNVSGVTMISFSVPLFLASHNKFTTTIVYHSSVLYQFDNNKERCI